MTILAAAMSLLYFIAVGVAFLYDRSKGRCKEIYADLDDDQISPLEDDHEPVAAGSRIESQSVIPGPDPVHKPLPLESRYDDMT